MQPFNEFFRVFTSNLLKYIEFGEQAEGSSSFRVPDAIIAVSIKGFDPFPLISPCRVMVYPREEMLASYAHFFVERAKDLRGEEPRSEGFTPLSIVKRLLADFAYVDRESLCVLFREKPPFSTGEVKSWASLFIIPPPAKEAKAHLVHGQLVMLSREDHYFRYCEALKSLSPASPETAGEADNERELFFGRFILKKIGKISLTD